MLYYKDYATADIKSIFPEEILNNALYFDLQIVESTIFFNEKGKFIPSKLPSEIQYAPVYAITATDVNEDGYTDLFFGGNQYLVKPQFGSYDASMGWAIFGPYAPEEKKPEVIPLNIKGQIRGLKWVDYGTKKIMIAPINDDKTTFHIFKNAF